MPKLSRRSIPAALVATYFIAAANPAFADAASFCANLDTCQNVYVENNASVTVLAVTLTQEQGDSSCEGGVKKTVSRALAGGTGIDPGQSFKFSANSICKYKIAFKTTKGCTGDKVTHIRPKDFTKAFDTVKLQGACGTLNAKVSKTSTTLE